LSTKIQQLFANTVWKMDSQNARLKIKHTVLLNVAIKTLFTPSSHKVSLVI